MRVYCDKEPCKVGSGFAQSSGAPMRVIFCLVMFSIVLISSATLAQQKGPEATRDAIGHPQPLPGPPPLGEPTLTTKPAGPAPAPQVSEPTTKGYTGAYAPAGTPPTPYSTGPLPSESAGPGLNIVGPDGSSTKTVKAVPCSTVAHETDGFTTCVGITDQTPKKRRRQF
jgi:hypothetical protein